MQRGENRNTDPCLLNTDLQNLPMQKRLYKPFENELTQDEGSFEDLTKILLLRIGSIILSLCLWQG